MSSTEFFAASSKTHAREKAYCLVETLGPFGYKLTNPHPESVNIGAMAQTLKLL